MGQAAVAGNLILVHANPGTREEVLENLRAFSDEGREKQQLIQGPIRVISSIPRMRRCYGWLNLDGNVFRRMGRGLRPPVITISKITRSMPPDRKYIAIVYEYVDEGENDRDVVQKALDFFWLAGFGHTLSSAERNWRSGVLIDLADVVYPSAYGWRKQLYGPRTTSRMLGL